MGTHPIFESDFDCLTDLCNMSALQEAMYGLISIFHEHAGNDKQLNKAELRKLLDQGLLYYYIKIFNSLISHIKCVAEWAFCRDNLGDKNAEIEKNQKFAKKKNNPEANSDVLFQNLEGLDQDESGFVNFSEFVTMVAALTAATKQLRCKK